MISDLTRDAARRALDGAIIVDQQPGDRAAVENMADVIDCPECDRTRIDPVAIVYQGLWRCRFCGTQIRLAIGSDRGIVDPAHGDLYVHVVRPGEPQPRPVPSSCLGAFRGEPWQDWSDPFKYATVRDREPPPDVSWVEFSTGLRDQDPRVLMRAVGGPEPAPGRVAAQFDSILGDGWAGPIIVAAALVVIIAVLLVGAVVGAR